MPPVRSSAGMPGPCLQTCPVFSPPTPAGLHCSSFPQCAQPLLMLFPLPGKPVPLSIWQAITHEDKSNVCSLYEAFPVCWTPGNHFLFLLSFSSQKYLYLFSLENCFPLQTTNPSRQESCHLHVSVLRSSSLPGPKEVFNKCLLNE